MQSVWLKLDLAFFAVRQSLIAVNGHLVTLLGRRLCCHTSLSRG